MDAVQHDDQVQSKGQVSASPKWGRRGIAILAVLNGLFLLRAIQALATWPASATLVLPQDQVSPVQDKAGSQQYEVSVPLTDVMFRNMQSGRLDFVWAAAICLLLLLAILYMNRCQRKAEEMLACAVARNGEVGGIDSSPLNIPGRRLRWFQFSLRKVFAVVFFASLVLTGWVLKKQREELRREWLEGPKYTRMLIMLPLKNGIAEKDRAPPSEDEVLRALELAEPCVDNWPFYFVERVNVRIKLERIFDKIEPPKVEPMVGPAQLHRQMYRATINYTSLTRIGAPLSFTIAARDVRAGVFIDHDHLHRFTGEAPSWELIPPDEDAPQPEKLKAPSDDTDSKSESPRE